MGEPGAMPTSRLSFILQISRRSALPGAEGSRGRAWPLRTSKASGFIFQMLLLRLCCLLFFLFVLHLLRLLALKFLPVKGHSSLCFPTSSPLTKPQSGMCGGPRPQGRLAAGEGSGPAQASPVTPVLLASAHGHLTGLWPAGLVLVTYPWILHGCESYSYSVQGQGNLRGFSWVVLACGLHEVSIKLPARAMVIRRLDQSRRVHFRGGSLSRPRGGVAGRLEASRPRL